MSSLAGSIVRGAEAALGAVLGVPLIGLSVLISRFHFQPADGVTVLARLADASLGHNWALYVIQFATMILLALSANTSFGGLPVLLKLPGCRRTSGGRRRACRTAHRKRRKSHVKGVCVAVWDPSTTAGSGEEDGFL